MNHIITEFDLEDCTDRLLAVMEKLEYLVNAVEEKIRSQIGPGSECAVFQHDIRINLDIMDDYIHNAVTLINKLRDEYSMKQ